MRRGFKSRPLRNVRLAGFVGETTFPHGRPGSWVEARRRLVVVPGVTGRDDGVEPDGDGRGYLRRLIARAATMIASTRLAADSTSISIFAQRLSGIVSVGLKAVAFVNETYR